MGPVAVLEVLVKVGGMQRANSQLMSMHATGQKVAGSAGKAAAAVSGVGAAGGRAGAGMKAAAGGADRAGSAFSKAGFGMSTSIGKLRMFGPLGAIAGASLVSMGVDFEDSMQKIVALVGISQKQVDQWSKQLMVLGPQLGKSPQELAEALYFLTSSGLNGSQAMDALTISAKASSAGLGDMTKIADAVSSAMNAYGPSVMSAAKATDILVATAKAGKAEPEELAAAMGRVLPIASQLGVSFQDVGGAVASMSLKGLNAAESVTSVRQILQAVLKPTQQAKKVMEEYGISADKVRSSLKEKGLLATLQDLRGKFKGNTEDLSRLFEGVEGFNGVLSLTAGGGKKAAQVFADVAAHTGLTQKAFDESKTAGFRFRQALAVAQSAGIALAGVLADLIGFFADNRTALTALMSAAAGVTAGFIALKAAAAFGAIIRGLSAAFWALNAALYANPIGVVIVALIALGAALYVLYQRNETFRRIVDGAWRAIKDLAADVWPAVSAWITQAWDDIKRAAVDAWPTIRTIILAAWAVIKAALAAAPGIARFVADAWNVIKTVTTAVWPVIKAIVTAAINNIKTAIGTIRTVVGIVTGVWNVIKTVTTAVWPVIKAIVTAAINNIKTVIATVRTIIGVLAKIWETVKSAAKTAWNAIKQAIVGPVKDALGVITGMVGAFRSVGSAIANGLAGGILDSASVVASAAAGMVTGALKAARRAGEVKSPSRVFERLGRFIGEGFVRGITGTQRQISAAMEQFIRAAKKVIDDDKTGAGTRSALARLIALAEVDNKKLQKLAKDRERIAGKLKAAKDNLDQILKARDDVVAGVAGNITGAGDITGFGGEDGSQSGSAIIAGLAAQVTAAQQMQTNLAALAAAGLNAGAIQQIANAGLQVGGATAAALVAEGGASIAAINSLQSQMTTAAQGIGATTGDALYKVGIQAAVGLVEGLKSQEGMIVKQMQKIARAMVRAIKKALGIKSPSTEFMRMGMMVAKGFELGVRGGQRGADGAIVQLGAPPPPPPGLGRGGSSPAAGARKPVGGNVDAAAMRELAGAMDRLTNSNKAGVIDALTDTVNERVGQVGQRRSASANPANLRFKV